MSYPRHLRTLIVEDDPRWLENYEDVFQNLPAHLPHDMFVRATSFEEAQARLARPELFHLVIFDLGLPETKRGAVEPNVVAPGLRLVRQAINREDYPVPACLVISGRTNDTSIENLREQMESDFWFGKVESKFDAAPLVQKALEAAQRYCEIGIHIRHGSRPVCPSLSPREDDLLRRCILRCQDCVGVDLEWWGEDSHAGQTKILTGRFLMRDGKGFSRPAFFKFEPRALADASHRNAKIFEQKLHHSRVVEALCGGTRSLLVTEKSGESDAEPLSIIDVLASPVAGEGEHLSRVARDVAAQLARLGDDEESQLPIAEVFRTFYNAETLRRGAEVCGAAAGEIEELLETWEALRGCSRRVWMRKIGCIHGDLNAGNLAFDLVPENGWRALVIDSGSMHADLAVRDFAALEVSLLLHQKFPESESPLNAAGELLYGETVNPPTRENFAALPPHSRHTLHFIAALRREAIGENEPWQNDPLVYALAVFDAALTQLNGFAHQAAGNKVVRPPGALRLVRQAAAWVRRRAPELF